MRKHGEVEKVRLESTNTEKDLGVNIDSELKFSKHVEIQVNKAKIESQYFLSLSLT